MSKRGTTPRQNEKTIGQGDAREGTWEAGGPAFRPGLQHPEPWREDLNPDLMAGQNVGLQPGQAVGERHTAYDDKEVHDRLAELPDDVLKSVPLVPTGSRLKQGATYLDLDRPELGEFKALGNEVCEPRQHLAAKADVEYDAWNLLRGIDRPLGRDEREVPPQGYELADEER